MLDRKRRGPGVDEGRFAPEPISDGRATPNCGHRVGRLLVQNPAVKSATLSRMRRQSLEHRLDILRQKWVVLKSIGVAVQITKLR